MKPTHPTEDILATTTNDISAPYRIIGSTRDAMELAGMLLHPEREQPAVVVSTMKNGPVIDPAVLASRLGGEADVYLLNSTSLAYDFSDAMPIDTSVYGGAARCYPPGTGWVNNSGKAMLRRACTEDEGRAAVTLLVEDVAAMVVVPTKMATSSAPRPPSAAAVHGVVSLIVEPDCVLVKLEDGIARIDTSAIAPGISPALLFRPAQKVTGTVYDGILTITDALHTVDEAAEHAALGTVQPALVLSPKSVALFPGLPVRHANDEPAGSIIAVQIVLSGRADGKAWKLATVPDPDKVTDALPFVAGAEPWIRWEPAAETPQRTVPAPVSASLRPAQAQGSATPAAGDVFAALDMVRSRLEHLSADNEQLSRELEALLMESAAQDSTPLPFPAFVGAEVERLRSQVALLIREKADMLGDYRRAMVDADDLADENVRLAHTGERLRDEIRTERARAARARQMSRDITDVADDSPLFNDPENQFRHEIYLEWAKRIPAASKAETPLAEYGFADRFLAGVEEIQGVERSKIIAVAVEVLTGLADSMPGRDMHRLRIGHAGAGFIEDPELGTAWRVALQVKTASARRMHFWRGTDGKVVFATVGVHDDMDI
ncbi:hypothetical protein [Arthrobacter oryzae]|uniref:hypothetical protein n=1 Tax=Arthrobacter oryzae TaxID=409290 RepID=UPI002181EB51|nr:hypothetical protein [Arthrobacter oryzae]